MLIEELVHSLLTTSEAVYDITPRVKPPGAWQNIAVPWIRHFPVAEDPSYTHGGREELAHWAFYQVSCFGVSWSQARLLAVAVRDRLEGNHDGVTFFYRGMQRVDESLDSDNPTQHIALNFEVFEAL